MAVHWASFDTVLGSCALAWGPNGVLRTWLPEPDPARYPLLVAASLPGAEQALPTDGAAAAVDGMTRLLAGEPLTLDEVALDLTGHPPFAVAVWTAARTVHPGETTTYGALATTVGSPGSARAVGAALGANPCPIVVPCHRVLAADGSMHGFSAPGGLTTKRRMLEREGAAATPPALFDL